MMLPEGWSEVLLEEVGKWGSGGTPRANEPSYYDGQIPWIRSGDLPDGPVLHHEVEISPLGLSNSSAKWVEEGAVLIAMYGATIGKLGIATYPVTTNQAVAFLNPHAGIDAQYIFRNLQFRKPMLVALGQGGAQPNISQEIIKAQTLPLPPTAEQRRIVQKLDALTAPLARAHLDLDRVSVLTERLRTSFLAAIFHGCCDAVQDDAIDERTKPLQAIHSGWTWKAVGSIAIRAKYLRVANVYSNELRLDDVAEIGCTREEFARTKLTKGDVLIVEGNGSLDQVGRAAIWNDDVPDCCHQNHLIRLKPRAGVNPKFVLYWLMSPSGRSKLERLAASTSGLHTLSLSKVAGLPIPIPPIEDQARIVDRIDATLARANQLEAEANRARAMLDRLESAILGKAFRGELVPQDPNDEPASVLLERIRAERAAAPQAKRGRRVKE
jgi:type I restriction enzyme S subunit